MRRIFFHHFFAPSFTKSVCVLKQEKENKNKQNEMLKAEREKYFIQMLNIKQDTGMTRIYSAIYKSDLKNPEQKQFK